MNKDAIPGLRNNKIVSTKWQWNYEKVERVQISFIERVDRAC